MTPSPVDPTALDVALAEDLARSPELAIALDFDGTLVPYAPTPGEVRLDASLFALLEGLGATPNTHVAVVSGRPWAELDRLLGHVPGLLLVAEHGVLRRDRVASQAAQGAWCAATLDGADLLPIERELLALAEAHPGALVERKLWSVCLHVRQLSEAVRESLLVQAAAAVERFVAAHPEHQFLDGAMTVEVRHREAHKGTGIAWLRERFPAGARVLALGDDITDEDTFAALGPSDLGIVVGHTSRPTLARMRLRDPDAVRAFLQWLLEARRGMHPALDTLPLGIAAPAHRVPLIVVSNRLPDLSSVSAGESERTKNVGGLVSGLAPALAARGGAWLGWSGHWRAGPKSLAVDETAFPARASFDLTAEQYSGFYNGFANRGLWPILHGFLARARYEAADFRAYVEVNELFASHAHALATAHTPVWFHDYHLFLAGSALRRRGHRGPLGFFLHVPFPPLDLFETIPWAASLVSALLDHDVIGFHTRRYVENFVRCAEVLAGAVRTERGVRLAGRDIRVGAFPLGIDREPFSDPDEDGSGPEMAQLERVLGGRTMVLGVDRLDYTKGIPQRLQAFARAFQIDPSWRGRATMVQVAVPSRADVPEYVEQREAIETLVGRINGEHGEAHWVPVRYLHRSYSRSRLARLYRAAKVGWVTPLRDGMNLVAKEYVAAQDEADPGVLVLSRFAGAAEALDGALLTNPHDREGMAHDLLRALSMPKDERIARHQRLLPAVLANRPEDWAAAFLAELEASRPSDSADGALSPARS